MTPEARDDALARARPERGPGLRSFGPALRCLVADNPGPLTLTGTCSWILGRHRRVIVDPGPDLPGHLDALVRAASDAAVEAICLTHAHADHAGCAARAAERLGAPLLASREALRRLGVAGRALEDGDRVRVDGGDSVLEALETPGHSADHLAFLWRPARALLTGDLVLGEGSSLIVHPDGNVGAYLASLARLISLRPVRLLPGHGPPVEEAVSRLEGYRLHRLERDEQVRRAVEAGARTPAAVREAVYGPLPSGLGRAAELSVLAHLAHLRGRGLPLAPELEAALEASARRAAPPGQEASGLRGEGVADRGTESGEPP